MQCGSDFTEIYTYIYIYNFLPLQAIFIPIMQHFCCCLHQQLSASTALILWSDKWLSYLVVSVFCVFLGVDQCVYIMPYTL